MDNENANSSDVGASMSDQNGANYPSTHLSTGLKTSVHGYVYQLNLVMLFAWRGHRKGHHEFVLATEMDAADKFDDVVFKYKDPIDNAWTWRFLQAKHKLSTDKKINVNDLLSTGNDDFALGKYFVSFCKIKNSDLFRDGKPKDFIIVTNAGMADNDDKAKGWNEYFVQENDFKSDYILSFQDEKSNNFNAWKFNSAMNDDIKHNLIKIFGSSMRRSALATNTVTETHHIKTYLAAIEMKKALQQSKIILANDDLDVQVKKTECLKWISVVVEVRKNMKYLKVNVEKLKSNLTNAKSDEQFSSIMASVDRLLIICRDTVKEYESKNSEQCKALENEKKIVADKVKLKELILKIAQLTNENELESIVNETVDNLKDIVFKNTLAKLKNCIDFDGKKIELHKLLEKVISDLTTVKLALENNPIEYVDEFFKKFRLVTNYPNQESLHELIKREVNAANEFNVLDADLVNAFGVFEEDMLKFFKNFKQGMAEFYHGEKASELFKGISSKITNLINIGMTTWYVKKLPNFDMRSKETNLIELEEFLSANEPQVFHLITECTPLSTLKVNEMLANLGKYRHHDSYILIDLETMFNEKIQSHVLEAFKTPRITNNREPYGLLVIECQSQNAKEDDEFDLVVRLSDILKKNETKKLILIAKGSENIAKYFARRFEQKFQSKEDHTSFDDLADESQNKLLEQKVNLQGSRVRLNELVNRDSVIKNKVIDSYVMCRLLQNKPILIGSQNDFSSTGYVEELYIERELKQEDKIEVNEEELLGCNQRIIIIADDAGMGKSTILTSLARKIKGYDSEMWVLRVNLLDYASTRNEINLGRIDFDHTATERAIEFLADMILPNSNDPIVELKKNLLKLGLRPSSEKKPKIAILFDAVDEISPTYKSKVINMLKAMAGSDTRKFVITTRFHVKKELEMELESCSFNLSPLNHATQNVFFGKSLKWHLIFFKDDHGHVRSRTYKEILQTIDKIEYGWFKEIMFDIKEHYQWNDDDKLEDLIKRIWQYDLSSATSSLFDAWRHKIRYKDFLCNPLNLSMLIDVAMVNNFEVATDLELLDIYDKFIQSKFKIKFDEKDQVDRGKDSVEIDIGTVEHISRNIHCELAVKLLIEEWQSRELPELSKVQEYQRMLGERVNVNEVIVRNGLLILQADQLAFIHRSFAEYFLNEYIIKNWNNQQVQELLFKTIIRKADFHINRIFFNSSLKQKDCPIGDIKKVLIEDLTKRIPIIHNLIEEDLFEIVKKILNLVEKEFPNKNSTTKRKLIMAYNDFGENLLYCVLKRRNAQAVQYLVQWVRAKCGRDTLVTLIKGGRVRLHPRHSQDIASAIVMAMQKLRTFAIRNETETLTLDSILFAMASDENAMASDEYKAFDLDETFEILVIIFDSMETHLTKEESLHLILTNEKRFGKNILYVLLEKNYLEVVTYLLDLVEERYGIDTLKDLIKRGRVENGKIGGTALFAVENAHQNTRFKTLKFTLDIMAQHFENDDFLKELLLTNEVREGRNILYILLEKGDSKSTQHLLDWVKEHCGFKTLMDLFERGKVVNNKIVECALFATINYDTRLIFKEILDIMAMYFGKGYFLDKLLLTNEMRECRNILYILLQRNDSESAQYLLDWVKEHCGINTFMDLIRRGKVVNGVILETVLFAAIKKGYSSKLEQLQLILNIMVKCIRNDNFLKEIVLANRKGDGTNILYILLENSGHQAVQYILDWVKQHCGIETFKDLVTNGKVFYGRTLETALHAAIKSIGLDSHSFETVSKGEGTVAFILDIVKKNVKDDEFLIDLVLAKHIVSDSNVFYYSPQPSNHKAVLYLINWIIKHLNVDVLKGVILRKRIGEIKTVYSLFEEIKKQDDASRIFAEWMLNFVNEHKSEII